jgi:hypothetical protein
LALKNPQATWVRVELAVSVPLGLLLDFLGERFIKSSVFRWA